MMLSRAAVGLRRASTKPSALQQFLFDVPSQPSLAEEFPGVPATKGKAQAPSAAQVTKLANGVTVASQDLNGAVASVGVTVKAGSRFESAPGTAHFLEHFAFASTQQRSALKLYRDVENMGGSISAKATRETFTYSGDVLRDSADGMVEVLAEAATQPKLRSWEVEEAKPGFLALAEERAAQGLAAAVEGVHAAAFGANSGLGHSFVAAPEDVAAISADTLRAFLGARYTGGNVVLAGVNVAHEQLVDAAHKFLAALPSGASPAPAKAAYTGGETMVRVPKGGLAHVAIGLPAPAAGSKGEAALAVLNAVLGGTPAKGLIRGFVGRSRAAAAAAAPSGAFIRDLKAFALPYSDAGLVGVAGTAADSDADKLIVAISQLLKDAATRAPSAEELTRAKQAVKLGLLAGVDARGGLREALARGSKVGDLVKAVDAVTAADVAGVAKEALAADPAVSVIGSLGNVPRYANIAAGLKA